MISSAQRAAIVAQSERMCREADADLLFLTLFGATLYGTESAGRSDLDVRGVFLPSMASLALNKAPSGLHYSSADMHKKNTSEDIDIDLCSVQHWLLKLLPSGDIPALDLLFSPSHTACTLYRDSVLDRAFSTPARLIETVGCRGYAEYCYGQVRKYGIKGSPGGALKSVRNWLSANVPASGWNGRLYDFIDAIVEACDNRRHCFSEIAQGKKHLRLCGKWHDGAIRMAEFSRRIKLDLQGLGGRINEAERNQGIDFKAVSHALRALDEMEELLQTGGICFPLKSREELIAVKSGRYAWSALEPMLLSRLAEVDSIRKKSLPVPAFDRAFAESCVLACYTRENTLCLKGKKDCC